MPVSAQETVFRHIGNGVTVSFPFGCQVLQATDLKVYVDDVEVTSGFTVSGIGVPAGGSVTFDVPPKNLVKVRLEREIALERLTDYQQNGDFLARVVNPDFNRLWMALQQHLAILRRAVLIPKSDPEVPGQLPVAADRANKLLSFDENGNPAVIAPAAQSATALQLLLSTEAGSEFIGFIQAGADAIARSLQKKASDIVNIKDFGASSSKTPAENRTALQKAIAQVDLDGGGTIVIDYDCSYGYKTRTASTWPDFAATSKPILILDYSRGSTQEAAVYPASYDGLQCRMWSNTPQTTSPGQHDGNTWWWRAIWAPVVGISNDAVYAAPGHASRTASDNRRAYFATYNLGQATWQFGQGTRIGASLTSEEMSNFCIQKFAADGDTLGDYVSYNVERKSGNISYGGGRNIPGAHHHFEATVGSPAMNIAMFESKGTTCAVTLRNSDGFGDDVEMRNLDGDLALTVPAVGDALRVNKSTRYVGIGAAPALYKLHVEESRSASVVAKFQNASATGGSVVELTSTSAASSGWFFANMYSGNGADLEFQLGGNGNAFADGSWTGGGADYAEFFEWVDGNPAGEDRRGYSVTLSGAKIKLAQAGDVVFGVISGNPSVVGDAAWNMWAEKYLRDEFGAYVLEDYMAVEWDERVLVREPIDVVEPFTYMLPRRQEDGSFCDVEMRDPGRAAEPARYEEVKHSYAVDQVPEGLAVPQSAAYVARQRRKLNPAYDAAEEYIPRSQRKEWSCVGLMGKLRVRKGQPVGDRWIKMRDISPAIEEWLVR